MSAREFVQLVAGLISAALIIAVISAFLMPINGLAAGMICGKASWYGNEHHGRLTASGARFNQYAMTAAMPSRAHLGERWRVTYNGKSVVVRINDVGPAERLHRIIDLSKGAAAQLGLIDKGVGAVCLERL